MKLEKTRKLFKAAVIAVVIAFTGILVAFVYVLIAHPEIVPLTDTFGSFWLRNFGTLVASAALAITALAAAYNALEQRTLRYMENYPFLEVFPLLSVDPLPLPVPKYDLPPELSSFNTDYLKAVAPSHPFLTSDVQFRYLAVFLRNAGKGSLTKAFITGTAEVPGSGRPPVSFSIARRFNLAPGGVSVFTLLPIEGLPEYKVTVQDIKYHGYFVELSDFEGVRLFTDKFPYSIPLERRATIFFDHFVDIPAGQGWTLDFWGQWKPTTYCHVPPPTENAHYLLLSGDETVFSSVPHFNGKMGAYKDIPGRLAYGMTVRVSALVRSTPGTTATVQLWCHDIAPNAKNRYSDTVVPSTEGEVIEMLYTSTQTENLRVHLLYTPGGGAIEVDYVLVEGLAT